MARRIISSADATSFVPSTPVILAGEALAAGNLIAIKTDGKAYIADANGSGINRCIGIASQAAALGASTAIADGGWVDGDAGLDPGQPVFLSDTKDGVSPTPSTTFPQALGYAITATRWVLRPDLGYILPIS